MRKEERKKDEGGEGRKEGERTEEDGDKGATKIHNDQHFLLTLSSFSPHTSLSSFPLSSQLCAVHL